MATKTLVDTDSTQSLSNKTLTSPIINTGTVGGDPSAALGIVPKQYVDALGALGAGRFAYSTATECLFSPYNGNKVLINSSGRTIPDAGVSFSNSGLANSTLYYAYLYMVGDTITGEFSTTAYATQAGTGAAIKSGDATRTLVGMVRTNASGQFVNTVTQRFVLSWFNLRDLPLRRNLGGSTASGAFVEINSAARLEFITWADQQILGFISGRVGHSAGSATVETALGLDGVAQLDTYNMWQAFSSGAVGPIGLSLPMTTTEGYHYLTMIGQTGAATATYTTCWISASVKG